MVDTDTLTHLVEPILAESGATLYDLTHEQGTVRVLVDREPAIDLDGIAELSRAISAAFDDADVVAGSYTLEVSSPGLERPLRTDEHFREAVGELVTVRLKHKVDGTRRVKGILASVDAGTVTVTPDDGNPPRTFPLDAVQKARTVFVWDSGSSKRKPSKGKALP